MILAMSIKEAHQNPTSWISVPCTMKTKSNPQSFYCVNSYHLVASTCNSTFLVYPSTMLESPGYLLSNYCFSFCVVKTERCKVCITQQYKTAYPSSVESQHINITDHKRAFNKNWPLEAQNIGGHKTNSQLIKT